MQEFDRLAPELRLWLAAAALPWSPRSAGRAWRAGLTAEGGDKAAALAYLTALLARRLAEDARRVWGPAHPAARGPRGGPPCRPP
jgi:hypothetical protein